MAACYRNSRVSIALSVLYVFAVFGMIVYRWQAVDRKEAHE